ncbi:MAG: GIY-YIG nuclease family protein [Lachnospiraceae bacterium]|nr:GIY-YIG nuclease family protein [Lachnospiraceae bacterium]
MNYTYILKCADGSLYTGWTNDIEKRVKAHNEGKGAKYTKYRRPVELVYYETFQTKQEAMRREYEIKHLPRKKKELLIIDFSLSENEVVHNDEVAEASAHNK